MVNAKLKARGYRGLPSLAIIKRIDSGLYRMNLKDLGKVERLVDKLLYRETHKKQLRKGVGYEF